MKHVIFLPLSIVSLCSCLVFLAGCGTSAPTTFYLLSPIQDTNKEAQAPAAEECIAIRIGPADMPLYLDRPQIVTRVSRNQMALAEFDQWAEPVRDNFTRVLAENLSKLLCAEPISIFLGPVDIPINFRVTVEVVRFDGELGRSAWLTARWMIFEGEERKLIKTKESSFSEPVKDGSYEALVSAMSSTIASLSRDIAEGIKTVLKT